MRVNILPEDFKFSAPLNNKLPPVLYPEQILQAKVLAVDENGMVKILLGKEVINAKINTAFDLTVDQLITLKVLGIEENKIYLKFLDSADKSWSKNTLVKLGVEVSTENRLILEQLLANKLELTTGNFLLVDKVLNNFQEMKIDANHVLAAILTIKSGLTYSAEGAKAIHAYLSGSEKFLGLLDRTVLMLEKMNVADQKIDGLLKNLLVIKEMFVLKDINVAALIKFVRTMAVSPEGIIAANFQDNNLLQQSLNKNICYRLSTIEHELVQLPELGEQVKLLKQILLGNSLLNYGDFDQIFVPFYFKSNEGRIYFYRRKNKSDPGDKSIFLEIKIEHKKLGLIIFKLDIKQLDINTTVSVQNEETKGLLNKNIGVLVEKLNAFGYQTVIHEINVIMEEKLPVNFLADMITRQVPAMKFPHFDLKV